VTDGAAFLHGAMLEDERTLLRRMAPGASFDLGFQIGARTLDRITLVRVVTVAATDLAGQHRMAVRQAELTALVEVALEAGFRRFLRIDDRAGAAAGLYMQAAGALTVLAAGVQGACAVCDQARMGRRGKVVDDVGMALGAFLGPDVFGARNLRRSDDAAVSGDAGNYQESPDRKACEQEPVSNGFVGECLHERKEGRVGLGAKQETAALSDCG